MSNEKNNEVMNLEKLQKSLVELTTETLKSNLTKTLERLETETELSNRDVIQAYKKMMAELEHVKNLVASLETINKFLSKVRIGEVSLFYRSTSEE